MKNAFRNGATNGTRQRWRLRLYVAGQTPKSITALTNLKGLCDSYLQGRYRIEVIDLVRRPHLARRDDVVVVPTLVRQLPPPLRRIIGDLSNIERVLVGLDLAPQHGEARSALTNGPGRRRTS